MGGRRRIAPWFRPVCPPRLSAPKSEHDPLRQRVPVLDWGPVNLPNVRTRIEVPNHEANGAVGLKAEGRARAIRVLTSCMPPTRSTVHTAPNGLAAKTVKKRESSSCAYSERRSSVVMEIPAMITAGAAPDSAIAQRRHLPRCSVAVARPAAPKNTQRCCSGPDTPEPRIGALARRPPESAVLSQLEPHTVRVEVVA